MLKLVKYLGEFGWEPVVYTADEAEYPIHDESLFKDIPSGTVAWRKKIWEPYDLYKKLIGQKKEEKVYSGFLSENKKPSFSQKASVWIRGNFFIPDARKFWIKPSIKFLLKKLKQYPVDAMISSGPPHTTHLIARGIKRKLNIPWIADFRDPWTQIDFYDQLMLTRFADRKHHALEKSVLKEADVVETVSWHWADDLEKLSGRKIDVITNGYDEDDFSAEHSAPDESIGKKFILSHIGSLNADRNPKNLWKALNELCNEAENFRNDLVIQLVGKNDHSVYVAIEENGLKQNLQRIDYVPHAEVGKLQQRAAILLLLVNDTPNILGIIPGKLFEYLAAKRPVLVVGSTLGDSARIIKETNAGFVFDFDEKEKMKNTISDLYRKWKAGELKLNSENIEKFSRRSIAQQFAEKLNTMIKI